MKILKSLALVLVVILLLAAGGFFALGQKAEARLGRTWTAPAADFPVPWPLSAEEVAALEAEAAARAPAEAPPAPLSEDQKAAIAAERALARGRHLLASRYACQECHGQDFGGGTMIDDPAIGRLLGPNLTRGTGSAVAGWRASDWSALVRHGVKRDGRPSLMPAQDFARMSDQELSDIVFTIQSAPPVDRAVPPPELGPVGTALVATGQFRLFAEELSLHEPTHRALPPPEIAGVELGAHLGQVCVGCHGSELAGGPIAGGDPSWPAASNLTPHESGMKGWSFEQFHEALESGRRPDGTEIREPMKKVGRFVAHMSETEERALFAWLQGLPPRPTPGG